MAKCRSMLGDLFADLIVLQECRRPPTNDEAVVWGGENPKLGTATASADSELRLDPVEIPDLHPTVVPVIVSAPVEFMFVGVWTHKPCAMVAWEALSACVAAAAGLPVVAAGDFNIVPRVPWGAANWFLRRIGDEVGLVSAYHYHCREIYGEETRATYYQGFQEFNPFHIDYCFIPESWADLTVAVQVGSFFDYRQSDHRPLMVDLAVNIAASLSGDTSTRS